MDIFALDHLVLTVRDLQATVRFYENVIGMRPETFGSGRIALHLGEGATAAKINLHEAGHEFEPKAAHPTPGSADLCFVTTRPVAEIAAHLEKHGVPVELGPVERTGARGPLLSVYFRDPDGNLIEVANRV
jgi:catechol 2,3-dioxygenase-like lactoylglutathione lyase family enzyme